MECGQLGVCIADTCLGCLYEESAGVADLKDRRDLRINLKPCVLAAVDIELSRAGSRDQRAPLPS